MQSPPESLSETFKRLGPAGVLAMIAAILPAIGGFALIAFMPKVSDWLRDHGAIGPYVYASGFMICSGLALVPTYAVSALGGYAFGIAVGLPAALAGFAGASLIGYEIARRASGDRVMQIVRERPRLAAVRNAFISDDPSRGFLKMTALVALVRMPPNSPFALTNIILASVQVPRACYLFGTVVGMAPRTAAAVWIGHSAGLAVDGKFPHPKWLLVTEIVGSVAVLAVVMIIAERALRKVTASGTSVS